MFLHGPDKKLSRYALSLPRRELKILVGLLAGHITLNRHLTVMKIQEDTLCPARGEQGETPLHFSGNATLICKMQIRYSIFGAHLMQPSELHKMEPSTLLRFARATEVLVTLGCNGDMHWAKLSNGLSTEWKLTPKTSNK